MRMDKNNDFLSDSLSGIIVHGRKSLNLSLSKQIDNSKRLTSKPNQELLTGFFLLITACFLIFLSRSH